MDSELGIVIDWGLWLVLGMGIHGLSRSGETITTIGGRLGFILSFGLGLIEVHC